MGISSSLLLKGITGTVGIATVSLGGIYAYQNGFFSSSFKETIQWEKELIKKLRTEGLRITAEPITSFDFNGEKTKPITFSTQLDDLKKWTCTIKFTKDTNNDENSFSGEDRDIFYKDDGIGFFQKIASNDNDNESLKERFIKKCSEINENNAEKVFLLVNASGGNLTIKNEQKTEFEDWFKDIKLSDNDKKAIEKENGWTLSKTSNTLKLEEITVGNSGDPKAESCTINVTGNSIDTIESQIKDKFGSNNITDTNKKYRRGFLKKCRNNKNTLNLDASNDLSALFDFSDEIVEANDKRLTGTWNIGEPTLNDNKYIIQITITSQPNQNVEICKIIGGLSSGSIDSSKFNSSKTVIKASIDNKIGGNDQNKAINRKLFLKKCSKSFGEEIRLKLKETEDKNKYEFEDLDDLLN